ncbi:MAG TPA: hypothetical protein DEE98_03850 [Elusimicrobia bacterium]|nr:MAG: hypothetical protein A2278_01180 [Elusimicrobia bacterium RIFOXYA12_FULL_49_49]OGS08332.1 MAG: hypothetical protein A2204_03540 [Elusimicrobia bacterium RIFOXYA1_FULL_47_7]OGS11094.1 MAG: hypothetical protein A2386_03740 [Elusimicrobia bacterium RIFOXYB1_FULL_48_9]OGS15809.1 MAG: hypothetical protein A2251_04080 [Elusimicrobia bacterium RIFOXYA2_FULL_47_53]OGS25997.1 MAG: hypothetical protein A2339_05470 [Elusimicrobia bacterium RIFOXYB12_FULL_50_12]OGS31141.1 MAG: hypothetical protein
MSYIFLDESGDLGFDFDKVKTSHYFVVSCLFVNDKRPVEKIVKKVFSILSNKEIRHHSGVLHCVKEHPKTRERLLSLLAQKDVSIISIYLDKKKVYTRFHNEKHVFYNYVVNILLDRIYTKKLIPLDNITLIASKRETNKFLNENFKEYLNKQINSNHQRMISIEIRTPSQEKCLQIVDFVCWAVFRKIEKKDDSYYKIISDKVREEKSLFA